MINAKKCNIGSHRSKKVYIARHNSNAIESSPTDTDV